MKITYLCPKHTEWVYSHPEQAVHFLARDEYQGIMLLSDGQFRESIAYLGCAFDIAAILYELDEGENVDLRQKLLILNKCLCEAYTRLDVNDHQIALQRRLREILNMSYQSSVAVMHA